MTRSYGYRMFVFGTGFHGYDGCGTSAENGWTVKLFLKNDLHDEELLKARCGMLHDQLKALRCRRIYIGAPIGWK